MVAPSRNASFRLLYWGSKALGFHRATVLLEEMSTKVYFFELQHLPEHLTHNHHSVDAAYACAEYSGVALEGLLTNHSRDSQPSHNKKVWVQLIEVLVKILSKFSTFSSSTCF
jgi:hypothetical protein